MSYRWSEFFLHVLWLHGIEPFHVTQAMQHDKRWPRTAQTDLGQVLTLWSRTRDGRALLVAVRPEFGESPFDWSFVGARWLTEAEEQELSRREETR